MKLSLRHMTEFKQIELLAPILNIEIDDKGIELIAVKQNHSKTITISMQQSQAIITYGTEIQLFRAISLLVQNYREHQGDFIYKETQQYKTIGVMLDCSRNAVLTVNTVKQLITHFALMGINMVMLYTEDTYEVKERPYFGYMRGRFTQEELKEIDDYGYLFGIELVPCIQTLGHMKMGIQWGDTVDVRDGDDVLLIDEPKTYEMIKQMIIAATTPFRSKRIHIGMDEAYQVGRGVHLDRYGYEERFSLMNRHLKNVLAITDEYSLKPMIWSDMFFGSSFLQEHTEEAFVTEEMIARLPKQVQYVYWDYFSEDVSTYSHSIKKHKQMGQLPIFAGGVWTWPSMAPNYGKTFATTKAAMTVCREEGIEEVFATLWGDNGQETNIVAGLLGIQLYAEYGYSNDNNIDYAWLNKRFATCTASSYEAFNSLQLLDEVPGVMEGNLKASNPSKFLLYQDLLLPLFDADIKGLPLSEHYRSLTATLSRYVEENAKFNILFKYYVALSQVLEIKSEISQKIKAYYDLNDKSAMTLLVTNDLSQLEHRLYSVQDAHRSLWFTYNKPFGWEVQDIRYGGTIARIRSSKLRLQAWINGEISKIEELEVERLNYLYPSEKEEGSIGRGHYYHRIVTASNFSG